jgi:hypothetical protein
MNPTAAGNFQLRAGHPPLSLKILCPSAPRATRSAPTTPGVRHSAATIINRITVDGQNYGGITQAMGLGLTEDFDDLNVHTTLAKCGIPFPNDVPDHFELSYIETPRPLGLLGQAGTGEVSLTALHLALEAKKYRCKVAPTVE